MLARLFYFFSILALLCSGCAEKNRYNTEPNVFSGKIERLKKFPSVYVTARTIDIWLPENYDKRQSYPVVYMHDGQMLFDSVYSWNHQEWGVDEVLSGLISEKTVPACIVVGIWNSGKDRHSDYFPQKPFDLLPKSYQDSLLQFGKRNNETPLFGNGIQSDLYLRFIVQELKPYVDKNYATKPDRAHTTIAGSSMGGLISLYALCEYPSAFGNAACLSTHWTGIFTNKNNPIPAAFLHYFSEHLPDPVNHTIYFDYGTETLDALYEPYQLSMDSIMRQAGYDSTRWLTKKFIGADHSEKAWNKRLDVPFTFILSKNN